MPLNDELEKRVTLRIGKALEWCAAYAETLPKRRIYTGVPWLQEDIDAVDALFRRKHAMKRANHQKRRSRQASATGSFTSDEWNAAVVANDGRCAYCKKRKLLTVDHVVPLSKGGTNFISNIVPACKTCNSKKGARLDFVIISAK